MAILHVTVVGKDLFTPVREKLELVSLNPVNEVKTGMLGNLTLLTYAFELPDDELIDKRRQLMDEFMKDTSRFMPMYIHGDWMRLFVFKPIRI